MKMKFTNLGFVCRECWILIMFAVVIRIAFVVLLIHLVVPQEPRFTGGASKFLSQVR